MKHWIYLFEVAVVLIVLTGVYFYNIPSPSFHPDESQWIATSRYFEPFIEGDFDPAVWKESYWTLTQPPLTRYIIALGRLAGGYQPDELNIPWKGDESDADNIARGAIPDPDLLWWSRLPMALLAAAAGGVLFWAASTIGGRVAGYGTLFFFVATPYLLKTLGRAMGEAPLLFWTVLAIGTAVFALHTWQQRQGVWWLVVVGVCGGLAGSAKLNGIAVTGTAVMLGFLLLLKYRKTLTKQMKWFVGTAVFLTPLITILVFYLLNPFLYTDTIDHVAGMLGHRAHAIENQQAGSPDKAITDLETRLQVVPFRIFVSYTPTQLKTPLLNGLLTAVGLVYLVWLCKEWFATDSTTTWAQTTALVTMSAAFFMVLPSLGTPLNWERYFLFPVIFNLLCTAVSLSLIWGVLVRTVQFGFHQQQRAS